MWKCLVLASLVLGACGTDTSIDANQQARRAYLALDESVAKSVQLGFDGYNAALDANIPAQTTSGDETGTLKITGQVDRSSRTMRLYVGMVTYSDGTMLVDPHDAIAVTYGTDIMDASSQPYLQLVLGDSPGGAFTGTLTGTYRMTGDLHGNLSVDLSLSGQLEAGPHGAAESVPGATKVSGTVMCASGTYDVHSML